jgi:hypothetical protein
MNMNLLSASGKQIVRLLEWGGGGECYMKDNRRLIRVYGRGFASPALQQSEVLSPAVGAVRPRDEGAG